MLRKHCYCTLPYAILQPVGPEGKLYPYSPCTPVNRTPYIHVHPLLINSSNWTKYDTSARTLSPGAGSHSEGRLLCCSSKGAVLGTPNREPQEYSRNITGMYPPGSLFSVIFLLSSWGSLFGFPVQSLYLLFGYSVKSSAPGVKPPQLLNNIASGWSGFCLRT